MKSSTLFGLAASMLGVAQAHTIFTTLYVNDVKQGQGDGTCVRQTRDFKHSTSPVVDLNSDDMACGVSGTVPVNYTCAAPAGAKLTFEYRLLPDHANSGFMDDSHKGPVAVYAKRLSGPDGAATGPGWFKLWGEGYDASTDMWATEKLAKANGLLSIDIPAALPAGHYLFRPEVVALHNTTPAVEPQFYIGCAQVFLETSVSSDLAVPAAKSVSIPGYLSHDDPSVTYNLYKDEEYSDPKKAYPMMGPEPFIPASPSRNALSASSGNIARLTKGAVPDDCLLVNGNWCGVEVSTYKNDQAGCWAAAEECWAQADACWANQPASGGRNCEVWGDKCQDLNDHCSDGDFTGPPAYTLKSNDFPPPGPIPAAVNADAVPQDGGDDDDEDDSPSPTPSSSSSAAAADTTHVTVTSSVPITFTVIPTLSTSSVKPGPTTIPDFTPRPTDTVTATTIAEPSRTPKPKPHCGGRRRRSTRQRQ